MKQFTLNKNERVKKQKDIDALFKGGKSFAIYPLRTYYLLQKGVEDAVLQFGCGAPKKHFKKAVDRNRIKRLLRETYRVQKQVLADALLNNDQSLRIFVIYTGKELPDFYLIKEKMAEVIDRLQTEINNSI